MPTIVCPVAGALQREIRQVKPFDSIEEEVFLNLQRTAEALMGGLSEVLKTFDLTATQYNVLRILRGAGPAGLPCREVSERMVNRDPDVTRLLDRLESRAFVERERLTSDRRVVVARIAVSGTEILALADPAVNAYLLEAMSALDRNALEALNTALESLRQT
jgi:DNA-binding MarR family transcriptional regulator